MEAGAFSPGSTGETFVLPSKPIVFLAPNGLKCHLIRRVAGLFLPAKKKLRVSCGDVIAPRNLQKLRGSINPARWTFDLAEVADRSFVYNYVPFGVTPLGAKFLIAKGGDKSQRPQDGIHLCAIRGFGFSFHSHLVTSHFSFSFVSQHPLGSVFTQPKQFAALAQDLARQIIERVDFVSAPSHQAKASLSHSSR